MTQSYEDAGIRFSMKSLMILVTVVCLVLALPGGYILVAVTCIWATLVTAMGALLFVFSAAINRFLAGSRARSHDNEDQLGTG